MRGPGLLAAFNALGKGHCSFAQDTWLWLVNESLLKSRFCDFSQLIQQLGERWSVLWFLQSNKESSVSSPYLRVPARSKADLNPIAASALKSSHTGCLGGRMFLLSITESLRPGGLVLNSVVSPLLPDLQTQCNVNQSSQQVILWWQRADSEMCMESKNLRELRHTH